MSSNPQVTIGVTAVDKASGVLRSLDQQVLGTTSKIEQSNDRAANTTEKASNKMIKSYASIAASAASLAAGVVSFATSFGSLEKAQSRVDTANVALMRSQDRLNRLQESGKATAEQLALAQEDLRVKTDQARIAQGDLSDTTLNFYAQMPSQLISFGTAAVGAYTAYTTATGAATTSTLGLKMATIAAFITNPIGIAIIAVTTLITLLVFNVGGLRDRFYELGKTIFDFLHTYFRPLADALQWFNDNILKPLGKAFGSEMPPAIDATTAAFDRQTVAIVKTGEAAKTASQLIQEYAQKFDYAKHADYYLAQGNAGSSGVPSLFDLDAMKSKYGNTGNATDDTAASGFAASQQFSFSSPGVTHGTPASDQTLKRQARRQRELAESFLAASGDSLDAYDRAAIGARALPARIDIHLDVDGKTIAVATVEDLFIELEKKSNRNKQVRGRSTVA